MKILISDAFDATLPDLLKKHGEVTSDPAAIGTADIILVRSKTKATKEYIDQAKNLKMIIRGGVGVDNIDVNYAKEKNIKVRNTAEASSIAVAELTFSLMMAIPNKIIEGDGSMKSGKWLKKELKRFELHGKTLGVIGCGRIGTEVAKRALAFGMKVVGYDPYVDVSDYIDIKPTLEEMLPLCDFITIHTPLTDKTKGFLNKNTIAKLKNGVVIVNTGRGKCVVEEDVVAALESGKIGGYGNDVWQADPPDRSPLLAAKNVVLTPHLGSSTNENLMRIGKAVDRIIAEFIANGN